MRNKQQKEIQWIHSDGNLKVFKLLKSTNLIKNNKNNNNKIITILLMNLNKNNILMY